MNKDLRPIPSVVPGETSVEKIQRFYKEGGGKVPLTPEEKELHNRLIESYKLLIEKKNKPEAVRQVCEIYQVDRSTAYRYLKDAELVFCKSNKMELDTVREIINSILIEAYKLAKKKKEPDMLTRIALAMIKNNGTDRDETQLPWKDWQPNLFYMVLNTIDGPVTINIDKAHELPEEDLRRILDSYRNSIEPDFELIDE